MTIVATPVVTPASEGPTRGTQHAVRNTQQAVRLFRTYKDGRAHLNAYLEDHAAMALGLLGLYEATFDLRWLEISQGLAEAIVANFSDPAGPGFYQTAADHERLIARRKDFVDNAVPSGNSLAAELLLHLGKLMARPQYTGQAEAILRLMAEGMADQPLAFGRLLCALDWYARPGREIAVIGEPDAADTRALLAELRRRFLPNDLLAAAAAGDAAAAGLIPLLADRGLVNGKATAYVCRDFACALPVTDPEALARQLAQ